MIIDRFSRKAVLIGADRALKALSEFVLDGYMFKNVAEGTRYWLLLAIPAAGGAIVGALGAARRLTRPQRSWGSE